jgi:hypothetical protein
MAAAVWADRWHHHEGVQGRQLGQFGPVHLAAMGQVQLQELQACGVWLGQGQN